MMGPTLDNRPREEHDFKDFYSDLDASSCIPVFINLASECQIASSATTKKTHDTKQNTKKKGVIELEKHVNTNSFKVTKKLLEYGYKDKSTKHRRISDIYIRRDALAAQHIPTVYDMDEQDEAWLEWLNEQLTDARILPEAFEVAISVLETKWAELESEMERVAPNGIHENRDLLTLKADYNRYGSDDGIGGAGSLTEQRCAVCNDSECENTNAIVFCDGCNIAVHQECYGIAFIPEGHWYCRRCMVSRGTPVSCTFCPSKTGAFKQLDNGLWSHVVCALWINEVYFANPIYMEPIEGINNIPKNRWKLVCYICKQRTGACIQCSNRNCFQAYHVTCAKRAGSFMAMEKGVQGAITSKATLKSFCNKHGPADWNRELVIHGIAQTRRFYRDCQLLSQKNDRLVFRRQQQNRQNTFKWKTEAGTPIAPQKFLNELESVLSKLNCGLATHSRRNLRGQPTDLNAPDLSSIKDIKYACAVLCRYWCLKREAKRGGSLVRLGACNLSTKSAGDLAGASVCTDTRQMLQKVQFGITLQEDLRKLISICDAAKSRQKLLQMLTAEMLLMADLAYFPVSTVASRLLEDYKLNANLKKLVSKVQADKISLKLELTNETNSKSLEKSPSGHSLEESCTDGSLRNVDSVMDDFSKKLSLHSLVTSKMIDTGFREAINSIKELDGFTLKPTQRLASACLDTWEKNVLPSIVKAEDCLKPIPFVAIDGLSFKFKEHNSAEMLAAEDLSEIEEDPFTDPQTKKSFADFLNSRF